MKEAFNNRSSFPAMSDGKPFVMSFNIGITALAPDTNILPLPIGGSDFIESGYDALLKKVAAVDNVTGQLVSIKSVAGNAFVSTPPFDKQVITYNPPGTKVNLSGIQMNIWDMIAFLRTGLLLVTNARFAFQTLAGTTDGADQIRQNITAFQRSMDGRIDAQSACIADYFKPDNKAFDSGNGALFSIDIPMNYVLSSSSALAFNLWFAMVSKTTASIHLSVQKCFAHDQSNLSRL